MSGEELRSICTNVSEAVSNCSAKKQDTRTSQIIRNLNYLNYAVDVYFMKNDSGQTCYANEKFPNSSWKEDEVNRWLSQNSDNTCNACETYCLIRMCIDESYAWYWKRTMLFSKYKKWLCIQVMGPSGGLQRALFLLKITCIE